MRLTKTEPTFRSECHRAKDEMYHRSELQRPLRWQGVDVSKRPEMWAHEVLYFTMDVPVTTEFVAFLADEIQPNLPWADKHFDERVCGRPINPGVEWKNWPWGANAEKFLEKDGTFNHNYMSRYWPKRAGVVHGPTLTAEDWDQKEKIASQYAQFESRSYGMGIRYPYGDLNDVVTQLEKEPETRQAVLPVFFPEDTGAVHGGRVPCSLHYHFLLRNNKLNIHYYLRSCDLVRHFRDDIYLTVRLQLWMLDRLRERNDYWKTVTPGRFVMMIGSLHCFRNDWMTLYGRPYHR